MPNITRIVPPRVPLLDERTGLISREWYRFFFNQYEKVGLSIVSLEDLQLGPAAPDNFAFELTKDITQFAIQPAQDGAIDQIAEMQKQIDGLNILPPQMQGFVISVGGVAPVVSSGGITPVISMAAANTTTDGYLTSADWNTFNSKQSASAPVTYTANFSVAATDVWVINNKSGSTCTATLPTPAANIGRILHFQNYQAQLLVSASANVIPIEGGAASTSILLAVAGQTATLVSNGTNWVMTQSVPNNVLLLE